MLPASIARFFAGVGFVDDVMLSHNGPHVASRSLYS